MSRWKPVLIENSVDWTALDTWSLASFVERFGNREIEHRGRQWRLGEYFQTVQESTVEEPVPYLKNLNIGSYFPELLPEIQPRLSYADPNYFESRLMPPRYRQAPALLELFIGGAGTRISSLHYDEYFIHHFITQIYGEKEFYFFPPEQGDLLYPLVNNPYISQVPDPRDPDLERFPRFAEATPARIVLKPGETVFVAPGWWHWTFMPGPSISVGTHCVNSTNWKSWIEDFCAFNIGKQREGKSLLWRVMRSAKWRATERYFKFISPMLRGLYHE